jgi:hypothetical protein
MMALTMLAGMAEADADASRTSGGGNGRVDSHQPAFEVHQRAAGIPGIDGSIGLDEVFITFYTEPAATQGADDTAGDGLAEAEGIADGHDEVPHPHPVRIGEADLGEILRLDLEHSQIHLLIGSNQRGPQAPTIRQRDGDLVSPVDDMIVGHDVAVFRIHHHTRSRGSRPSLLVRNIEKTPEKRIIQQRIANLGGGVGRNIHHRRRGLLEHGGQTRQRLTIRQRTRHGGLSQPRQQTQQDHTHQIPH